MTAARTILDAIKTGRTQTIRVLLATAAVIYAMMVFIAPDLRLAGPDMAATSYILSSGWKNWWAGIFLLDGVALWWRLIDSRPRQALGAVINLFTLALWTGITGGTVVVAKQVDPDLTGYFVLCAMALYTLIRTEFTPRDRETA